jgi:[ribosomal protein S5]-alanine N-acetyltransferase
MNKAIIFGEKIYFRPLELADIDDGWLDWVNDWAANRFRDGDIGINRDQLVEYHTAQKDDATMLAVCRRRDDRYIGNVRLSSINWVSRSAGYGRLLDPAMRGQGYGTDSLIQLLRYGFHHLGLNRMWGNMRSHNIMSESSNDKAGMRSEGIWRQFVYKDGRYWDVVHYAMLRDEFDSRHGAPAAWTTFEAEQMGMNFAS